MRSLCESIRGGACTLTSMKHAPARFVSVSLTENQYQALRHATPDPAAWIKTQIEELLDRGGLSHVRDQKPEEPVVPAWSYSLGL